MPTTLTVRSAPTVARPSRHHRIVLACATSSAPLHMARAFLRAHAGGSVLVATTSAFPFESTLPETAQVMREEGFDGTALDLPGLDVRFLRQADLVITMGPHGAARPRFVNHPVEDWVLPATTRGDLESYRRLRDRIEELVRDLVVRLERRRQKPERKR